ncbi:MAG TPA: glycosyltransferase [Hyphomonas sp.]|nr:glycosyltransferase [Geminicoccaceae bacterium]HRX72907.1 glycosyltransferase [Hyphomonas sp.]
MRVLVVNPSLFAPAYDYHFCRALTALGVHVTMVGRPLRSYEQQLAGEPFDFAELFYRSTGKREAGGQTSRLGRLRKGVEHALGLRALEALAAEQDADIVHFQWLVLPFLDRIALDRLRRRSGLVLTVHNAELTTHSTSAVIGRLGALLQSLGRRRAVLGFDRYVTHTTNTADQLRALGIAAERILLLPHPPLDLEGPASSSAPTVDNGRREILFFGAIKPYKGIEVLVDAGIALAAARRDFRITIAGRPFQPMDRLRARIAAAGANDAFRFDLDYLPDNRLAAYLAEASIIVFPYRKIDGSGALSHAIRFGKPIVASRVGGFAEAPIKDHLELVPAENPVALAATLASLLDAPDRLAALARRCAALEHELPSWRAFAEASRALYAAIPDAPRHR